LISMQLLEVVVFFLFLCIRLVFRVFFSRTERFCFLLSRREIRKFSCAWHSLSVRTSLTRGRSFGRGSLSGLLLFLLWRVFSFSPFAVCDVTKKSKLLEAIVLVWIQNFCSDSV
jgi:hypothetical protein